MRRIRRARRGEVRSDLLFTRRDVEVVQRAVEVGQRGNSWTISLTTYRGRIQEENLRW